jgi:hypothetical protein
MQLYTDGFEAVGRCETSEGEIYQGLRERLQVFKNEYL